MIGQICRKVALIGQNRKVVQNSQGLVELALTAAIETSRLPGGSAFRRIHSKQYSTMCVCKSQHYIRYIQKS